MGTRSLTLIKEDGTDLVCFYKQYDGYPDGYGKELVEFLKSGTLVNGIPYGDEKEVNKCSDKHCPFYPFRHGDNFDEDKEICKKLLKDIGVIT